MIHISSRRPLIYITVYCDDIPIKACVDTGSMMNIVSKRIWESSIRRPYDKSERLEMVAANNEQGHLQGIIKNVELTCGDVRTWAYVYIADNAPFDLLLERLWQLDNQVSIIEKGESRTWLLFGVPYKPTEFGALELKVYSSFTEDPTQTPDTPAATSLYLSTPNEMAM